MRQLPCPHPRSAANRRGPLRRTPLATSTWASPLLATGCLLSMVGRGGQRRGATRGVPGGTARCPNGHASTCRLEMEREVDGDAVVGLRRHVHAAVAALAACGVDQARGGRRLTAGLPNRRDVRASV